MKMKTQQQVRKKYGWLLYSLKFCHWQGKTTFCTYNVCIIILKNLISNFFLSFFASVFVFCIPAMFANELLRQEEARLNEARKISVVNVNPTNIRPHSDTPEIRKYKKRFNSEILCAALWGRTFYIFPVEQENLIILNTCICLFFFLTFACFCVVRCEPAGGNREWSNAAWSKWTGESL